MALEEEKKDRKKKSVSTSTNVGFVRPQSSCLGSAQKNADLMEVMNYGPPYNYYANPTDKTVMRYRKNLQKHMEISK